MDLRLGPRGDPQRELLRLLQPLSRSAEKIPISSYGTVKVDENVMTCKLRYFFDRVNTEKSNSTKAIKSEELTTRKIHVKI